MWTAIALSQWRVRIQPDKKQARLRLSIWVGWWQVPDRYLLARILPYLALLLINFKCHWMFSRRPQLVSRIELNLCSDFLVWKRKEVRRKENKRERDRERQLCAANPQSFFVRFEARGTYKTHFCDFCNLEFHGRADLQAKIACLPKYPPCRETLSCENHKIGVLWISWKALPLQHGDFKLALTRRSRPCRGTLTRAYHPWKWVKTKWRWLATQDHAKLVD